MTPLDLADPTTATLAVARALEIIGARAAVYGGGGPVELELRVWPRAA